MSMNIQDTSGKPIEVSVQSHGDHQVSIGGHQMKLDQFLHAALYVLEMADLRPNDPRLAFLEIVQSVQQVPGYNIKQVADCKRLELPSNWPETLKKSS